MLEKEQFRLGNPKSSLIIGLGHEAQQGKDTVAAHLIQTYGKREPGAWGKFFPLDIRRYAFADTLKVEVFDYIQARTFLVKNVGFKVAQGFPQPEKLYSYQEKIDYVNTHKEELRPELQKWGTEYRRQQAPDYWVSQTLHKIYQDKPDVALIPDMRFKNEAAVCDYTLRVIREGFRIGESKHASEQELNAYPYHYVLSAPEGDVEGLKKNAESIFEHILKLAGLLPH